MNLLYRTACLHKLISENPIDYGFNTVQVGFDYSNVDQSSVINYINSVDSRLKILLAFVPYYKDTNNILNPIFSGKISFAQYDQFENTIRSLIQQFPNRIVGIRWNHEYRPAIFMQTSTWEMWLRNTNYAMWQYVINYQRNKWNQLLSEIANYILHPIQFLEKTSGTFWDSSTYTDFRTTFRLFVKYICQYENNIFSEFSRRISLIGSNLKFYLYPGGYNSTLSPRTFPDIEYSLDQNLLQNTYNNLILELGSWSSFTQLWIDRVTSSVKLPFMYTCQLDLRCLDITNAINDYDWRMNSLSLINTKAESYGFWSDWTNASRPDLKDKVQKYLNDLKTRL